MASIFDVGEALFAGGLLVLIILNMDTHTSNKKMNSILVFAAVIGLLIMFIFPK
jgi:hypothetical protein